MRVALHHLLPPRLGGWAAHIYFGTQCVSTAVVVAHFLLRVNTGPSTTFDALLLVLCLLSAVSGVILAAPTSGTRLLMMVALALAPNAAPLFSGVIPLRQERALAAIMAALGGGCSLVVDYVARVSFVHRLLLEAHGGAIPLAALAPGSVSGGPSPEESPDPDPDSAALTEPGLPQSPRARDAQREGAARLHALVVETTTEERRATAAAREQARAGWHLSYLVGARLPHGFAKRGLELKYRTSVFRSAYRGHMLAMGCLTLYYAVCGSAYVMGVASAGVDCGYKQACAIGAAVAGLAIRFRLHRRKDREAAQRHGALVGAAYLAALARYNALQGGATSEAAGGADAADASLPARIAAQSMAAALVYDVGGVVLLHFGFFTLSIGAPTRLVILSLLCPLALPAASWRATLPYWLVMQLAVGAIAYGFEASHRQSYLRLKREDPRPTPVSPPPRLAAKAPADGADGWTARGAGAAAAALPPAPPPMAPPAADRADAGAADAKPPRKRPPPLAQVPPRPVAGAPTAAAPEVHPLSDEYATHWLTLRCVTAAHEAELCAAMFHDNFALHLAIQLLCFCLLVPLIQAGGRAWVGHAVVFACAPFTLLMMAARVWLHRLADRHLAQRLGTKTLFRVSYAALAASRLPDLLAHFDVDAAALLLPPAAATAPPPPRPFGWVPFLGGGGGGGARRRRRRRCRRRRRTCSSSTS